MNPDSFELELPTRAEHLGTARSFVAAVARRYAVSGETVEDLKLAVSEACTDAMAAEGTVRVRAETIDRSLTFEVEAPERSTLAAGLDEPAAPARMDLVRTLFPDATLERSGDRRVIRFSFLLP